MKSTLFVILLCGNLSADELQDTISQLRHQERVVRELDKVASLLAVDKNSPKLVEQLHREVTKRRAAVAKLRSNLRKLVQAKGPSDLEAEFASAEIERARIVVVLLEERLTKLRAAVPANAKVIKAMETALARRKLELEKLRKRSLAKKPASARPTPKSTAKPKNPGDKKASNKKGPATKR